MAFSELTLLVFSSNITTILIFVFVLLFAYFSLRKPIGIPPGSPFTLPVIGDLALIAATDGDIIKTFRKLRSRHGDIFSFYIGKDLTVVINGFELIHKAAVKNGWRFSGRPDGLINNVATHGRGVILANGPLWKRQRKFTVSCLQEFGFGKRSFEHNIMKEVQCLVDIFKSQNGKPLDIKDSLYAAVENILFSILYGKRYDFNDTFYQGHLRDNDIVSNKLIQASMFVSCLPWLQYLPGDLLGINVIKTLYKKTETHIVELYHEHIIAHDENNPRDFMDMFITEMKRSNGDEDSNELSDFKLDQMAFLIMDLFGAGADTTSSTIQFAILLLLHHPGIQQRLHLDIENIIPGNRLPNLQDKDKLPYVEAFIMEVQRFANVVPLAVPHCVTSDDVIFEGYRIPKQATVLFNIDSVFIDPNSFENPNTFNPQRFLDANGHIVKPKELIPFGIGRRLCLGESVAKMELFLFLTILIKTFDFRPVDESNIPSLEREMGTLILHAKPFKARAVTRFSPNE